MAKKRKSKQKLKSDLLSQYNDEITYYCPKRGKVTEKVNIKRYKAKLVRFIPAVNRDGIDKLESQSDDSDTTSSE